MNAPRKIGFIGLGIMGGAMARNLAKAGYTVTVYNRTRQRTSEFADMGCEVSATTGALAKACDTVITMVSDPAALDAVLEGPEGVFSALAAGSTLINMGTMPVDYTFSLAQKCLAKGVIFADCPVSGSKPLAETAKLVILAAGERAQIEKLKPVLLAMGRAVVYAGPAPKATALKLCVNLIVAQMTTGLAEAAALGTVMGLDSELIFQTLGESAALNCGYFNAKKNNLIKRQYPPEFPLKHMLKDTRFMLEEARKAGLALPVTQAVEKLMNKSYNNGGGDSDLSIILKTLESPLK